MKQKEGAVVSATPGNKYYLYYVMYGNIYRIMKRTGSYISAFIGTTLLIGMFTACSGPKELAEPVKTVKLSESKQREYNYALTEATKQKIFGNFKQAAMLYRNCIEVNPGSDVAHFQLAGIYMAGRNLKAARMHNRIAVELDPDNYWYKIQLAQIYRMDQAIDSAVVVYEDIVRRWPEKLEVRFELARLYSEQGQNNKSLKILDSIEKEYGLSEKVSLFKEQIYVKEKKYERAIEELNKLILASPENINYLGILAELYSSIGKRDEAMSTYQNIFEIEPENGIAQLSMAEFYRMEGDSAKQFRYLYLAMNNPDLNIDRKMAVVIDFLTNDDYFSANVKGVDSIISILSLIYPEDFRVRTARADYYTKLEMYPEALALYDKILEETKGNYFIWEQAIFIENFLGNNDNVYNKCSEALRYFNDKPFLYLFLGNSALQKGNNREAITALEKGLKLTEKNIPLTVQIYSILAEAHRNLGNNNKSDEYFDLALGMEPDNIMIMNNYAYYLSLRGENLEKAEKMSRKTIVLEPDNATYLDTYAWILYKSEKFTEAVEYMQKAMDNGGREDPDIVEHFAEILNAMGEEDKAGEYLKKAAILRGDTR